MFRKKNKEQNEETNDQVITKYERPKIITFNFSKSVEKELSNSVFEFYFGSLGNEIRIHNEMNKGHFCLPNHNYPPNLHEYDIFIFDMYDDTIIDYNPSEHKRNSIKSIDNIYLYCQYPKNIFDSKPISGIQVSSVLSDISKRKSIVIIFCNEYEDIEFDFAKSNGNFAQIVKSVNYSNYSYSPVGVSFHRNKNGKIFNYSFENNELKKIFDKYLVNSEYNITFKPHIIFKDYERVDDPNFIPLILNNANEVVSYLYFNNKQLMIYLPNINNKGLFINDFLSIYLPDICPELFPNSERNQWLNSPNYYLPNHKQLILEKEGIINDYDTKLKDIEDKIEENKKEFDFLHDLIIASGENLVLAVIKYLKYLGFTDVRNMDEINGDIKEEDIQIILENMLIVIEVKGIGGTSTDSDCSQISKIRFRRCNERGDFNVHAIYLVNHQRHIPPDRRVMPPFTDNQIKDAIHDKRSLLTTFQLFQIYYLIEEGIFKKEDVRTSFLKHGFINFIDDYYRFIGKIEEIFNNGKVFILTIKDDVVIRRNDCLLVEKDDNYYQIKIESLQINSIDVDSASNCEIGIKVNKLVKNNSFIYIKK